MPKKMLIFEFRSSEYKFFDENKFEGYDISFYEEALIEKNLDSISVEDKNSAEIISVFIGSKINKEVLDSFKNLKVIATRSTGFNHINIEECQKHGVAVVNVSNYGTKTVVQFTVGLMLALVRKLLPAILDMRNLENNQNDYVGRDLNNLTLGVVGTGAIGAKMCEFANFAGMEILAYDFYQKTVLKEKYGVKYVDLESLIKNSDIITLHIPFTEENYHLFSTKEFMNMKNTAYLINTSRGEIVDTYALYKALKEKQIQGVALDVGECEDVSFDMKNVLQYVSDSTPNCLGRALVLQKMLELPNAIITPHIAYSSEDAIESILKVTFENISKFYTGEQYNRII